MLLPLERLQDKQVSLLVRLVLLEAQNESQLTRQDLPPFPALQKPEEKSFRSNNAFLTTAFRERESELNQHNDAVLSALHVALEPLPEPASDTEKKSIAAILVKRAACKALAEAQRGEDTSKTAVAIYELAEEVKKARADVPAGTRVVATLPPTLQMADLAADRMIESLAVRFTLEENSEIAKALDALRKAF